MPARVAKAAKDAKTGRKAVQRVASKVKKAERQLDDALDKLQGVNKKTPGRKSAKDGITVGKKRTQADRRTQKIKGAAGGAAATGAASMGTSKKTTTPKRLPLAKEGKVDVVGTGKGMKYYQNGKQVRIK